MSKRVRIGVFIPAEAQLLDVAAVDALGVMSKEYLGSLTFLPPAVVESTPIVDVFYITTAAQKETGIPLTSGMTIKATHAYSDEEVSPGKLDIVFVPGPNPASAPFDAGSLKWLREQAEIPTVDILCVCTGLFVCGAAGIADGKEASGPRGMQDMLRQQFPKIKLVGDNYRWVQDGNFWSSGGVTNGNDLVAAYARSGKHWSRDVVELGLSMTETGDRENSYKNEPIKIPTAA